MLWWVALRTLDPESRLATSHRGQLQTPTKMNEVFWNCPVPQTQVWPSCEGAVKKSSCHPIRDLSSVSDCDVRCDHAWWKDKTACCCWVYLWESEKQSWLVERLLEDHRFMRLVRYPRSCIVAGDAETYAERASYKKAKLSGMQPTFCLNSCCCCCCCVVFFLWRELYTRSERKVSRGRFQARRGGERRYPPTDKHGSGKLPLERLFHLQMEGLPLPCYWIRAYIKLITIASIGLISTLYSTHIGGQLKLRL